MAQDERAVRICPQPLAWHQPVDAGTDAAFSKPFQNEQENADEEKGDDVRPYEKARVGNKNYPDNSEQGNNRMDMRPHRRVKEVDRGKDDQRLKNQ